MTKKERIARWMQDYVDQRKFPGCSVLIEQAGEEVYYAQAGLRDVGGNKPFERDTIVRIYSMTKPITSALLMSFVEEGRVHLDTKVSELLPKFNDMHALVPGAERIDQVEPCEAPTLHQLLTHTSGFSYAFNPGIVPAEMEAQKIHFAPTQGTLSEMNHALPRLPLAFRPGTRWEYSVGIDVIGRVIEVLAGHSLNVVFRERILDPLGMEDTHFTLRNKDMNRFAHLYTPLAGNPMGLNDTQVGAESLRETDTACDSPFSRTTLFSGGGGLIGTIDDYMRFCRLLHDGQGILSPRTLAFMRRNHLPGEIASMGPRSFAEQPMEGMGFGIGGAVVLDPARTRTPGHVGDFSWGGMASTAFWIDPSTELSVVFFTQLAPSSSYPARPQLKALVHGALD